jgi:serine/threonine protein kinase
MTLNRFVSGALGERVAEEVAEHLAACDACQARADRMAHESDSLIEAARRPIPGEAGEIDSSANDELARLIARVDRPRMSETIDFAVAPDDTQQPRTGRPKKKKKGDIDSFISGLRKSGLVPDREIDRLISTANASDIETLMQELVDREVLTPYQARALARGRWKGLILNEYEILEKLGKGGMGHVYMARHRKMGRIVCLKVLRSSGRKSPEVVERFRREIRTISSLKHPNFVVAHDASESDGIQFLVMEYIEGHDLSRQVRDDGPLPVDLALELMQQVAEGLQYAHDQGVVHRDIKPHNLLVAEDEDGGRQVKVLDLGLARFDTYVDDTTDAATHVAMTATGVIMGTVDYMSPEQALNSHYADARSDIYSLGCTLHFLLTGRGVYSGETLMEKLVAHREQPIPDLPVPGIAKGTNAVFRKLIAKDPANRYQTMAEVVEDLDACRSGRRPSAMPPLWQSGLKQLRQSPRKAAAIGVALLLMLGLWSMLPLSTASDSSGTSIVDSGADDSDQARRGAASPNTVPRNGMLPPLVLVAVGTNPDGEDYSQVVNALTNKGFQVQPVTSEASIYPKLNGRKMYAEPLTSFSAGEFYSLAFIDGGEYVFTHKNPKLKDFVHGMIHETMNRGGIVVGVNSAQWVLDDAGVGSSKRFDQCGLSICQPNNAPGMHIRVKEGKHASHLADFLARDFRKRFGG